MKKNVTVIGHLPTKIPALVHSSCGEEDVFSAPSLVDDDIPSIYLKEASRFHVQ